MMNVLLIKHVEIGLVSTHVVLITHVLQQQNVQLITIEQLASAHLG